MSLLLGAAALGTYKVLKDRKEVKEGGQGSMTGSIRAPRKAKELLLQDYDTYKDTGFHSSEAEKDSQARKASRAGAQAMEQYFGPEANREALMSHHGMGEQTDNKLDKLAAVGELGAQSRADVDQRDQQMALYKQQQFRAALSGQQDRNRENAQYWTSEGVPSVVDTTSEVTSQVGKLAVPA